MTRAQPPVITIDGPSASGKGTVAELTARGLGFHYLDSGALYRLVGYAALKNEIALDDEAALTRLAGTLDAQFKDGAAYLDRELVGDLIRTEQMSAAASAVAALPGVRRALLERQRAFREYPGLVADGRDMGTVVFPDAELKIYLIASAEERARRRYKQLKGKGIDAKIATLLHDIQERDARDSKRAIAPLQKSSDAIVLDTTELSISAAVDEVLTRYAATRQVP